MLLNSHLNILLLAINYKRGDVMNILTKYLLKSIAEKKGRTFLILFSILISTALLVGSLGIANSISSNYENEIKGAFENFNVSISPNEKSANPFFNELDIKDKNIKDSFKTSDVGGYVKNNSNEQFKMLGTTINDFKKFKSIKMLKKASLEPFTGNKIIISKKTSDNLKLKLGDKISLYTLGKTKDYIVSGIASNNGLFLSDKASSFVLIAPLNEVCSLYGEKDKYTSMYVEINSSSVNTWIKNFNKNNSNFTAKLLIDESELQSQVNIIKTCLLFMLCIVLIMTVFIIYSSFKLIIIERISTIGTFLSQGATKLNIVKLLLKESFIYGIIGGTLGNLLGIGIICASSTLTNPLKEDGIKAAINLSPSYFIAGFILALIVSIISSLIPILSIRKMSVKEIILCSFESSNTPAKKSFILGIILIIVSILLHFLGGNIKGQRPYLTSLPGFFMAFAGIIIIIPKLVDIIFYPFVRWLRKINGTSMLTLNNVRTSKVLLNNIRLLSVSIISIVMIMSLSASLNDLLSGVYEHLNYNISIDVNSDNTNILKTSKEIINDYAYKAKVISRKYITADLNGDSSKEVNLLCIEPQNFKNYDNYLAYTNKDAQLDELDDNEDGVIISKRIATRYNVKKGDFITLSSNNKDERLKVLSIVDAKLMNMGNVNLISFKGASKHFNIKYPDEFFISTTSSVNKVKNDLITKFKGLPVSISTKQENIKNDKKNNGQLVDILSVFSYLTAIIGGFGILSNVSISLIQRKREIAVLSSLGLTNRMRGIMLALESVFEAIIGLVVSLISAGWIITILMDIFKYLALDMKLNYPISSIPFLTFAVFILMLITTLPALKKAKKLQIVKELKYE